MRSVFPPPPKPVPHVVLATEDQVVADSLRRALVDFASEVESTCGAIISGDMDGVSPYDILGDLQKRAASMRDATRKGMEP